MLSRPELVTNEQFDGNTVTSVTFVIVTLIPSAPDWFLYNVFQLSTSVSIYGA